LLPKKRVSEDTRKGPKSKLSIEQVKRARKRYYGE